MNSTRTRNMPIFGVESFRSGDRCELHGSISLRAGKDDAFVVSSAPIDKQEQRHCPVDGIFSRPKGKGRIAPRLSLFQWNVFPKHLTVFFHRILLSAVLIVLSGLFGFAQERQASTPSAASPVSSRRIVRVGYNLFSGYHDIDVQGRRSGFGYDYLQHL